MQKTLLLSALLLSSLPMLWAELSTGLKAPEFSLKHTSGKSLESNVALVLHNAEVGAQLAREIALLKSV